MKTFSLLLLLTMAFIMQVNAQLDTANITITNFKLHDGTFNWRGTNTYFNRTSFNSDVYTEGHLKRNNDFRQNFRLLIPQGYDPNYKPGYPIMLVWHGAVERANCFDQDCYHGTRSYNPNTAPIPNAQSDLNNLLNNDHQLLHGANQPHIPAWNTAGTMKIDNPALPVRAFPGFVVFPQNLNGWGTNDIRDAIRIVRLLVKKYNIDPDRIYTHGLSNGGMGLLTALVEAPWMFSAAAVMSPITSSTFRNNAEKVASIPIWFFQGGKDDNPTPAQTQRTLDIFRAAGGNPRFTLYPDLGHGTWNTAYREPDFFTWFLGNIKSDIHISYGSPTICGTNDEPVVMTLPAGFYAYQWERNGTIIAGATSHTYSASQPGTYRARYSRVSATPTEDQWNRWSSPVNVTESTPPAPQLDQIASIVLRDLNNFNTARLVGPVGFQRYYWYKDGVLTNIANTNRTPSISSGTNNSNMGSYTLVTANFDNCPSPPSNAKQVFFSNLAPINIPTPTGFSGTLTEPTTVLLRWNDVSGNERNYEIWRRRTADDPNTGWTFVTLTEEDAIIYEDRNLLPGTEYWYKIRAVSNEGRSNYAPGDSKTNRNQNLIISTEADNTPPAPPQNLTAALHDTDIATKTASILLTWVAPSDGDIKEYDILYGQQTITITDPATTNYVVNNLPLNSYFNFRVVARDQSGNNSAPSNQANANTFIDGFFWEHSTAAYTDIRQIPDQLWNDPEYKGRSANLTLEPALQEEFLVFRFYGYLYITTPGEHQLRLRVNDGVQIFVDGELRGRRNGLVADGTCATTNFSPNLPIYLDEGPHSIEIRYLQYTGSKCLSMEWRGPDAHSNPNTWQPVPDNRIRSYPSPPVNNIPPAPIDLQAVATGMTQIDLSWNFDGIPPVEYEIYRSLTEDGTYSIINRTGAATYEDQNLLPGTTYFYKLKTVSGTNSSEFSQIASATTETDTEAPTQPTGLTLFSNTLTTASIAWTKSEDNTQVMGYEVYVNGVLHSTAPTNFHLILELQPFQTYNVYVVAYDANGNKSEPSNTVTFETNQPDIFYSKATGNLNAVATWGRNPDGSGDAPLNFTTNGSYFIIANRGTSNVGGLWKVDGTVSKIIVPSGITLTAESAIQGRVEVQDDGVIILSNSTIPTFVNLGVASTVQYNQSSQQIQRNSYGNLVLMGTSAKTFASGTTTVFGNLTVANNIGIKGAGNNQSTLVLYGDLTCSGTPGFTQSDVTLAMDLRKNGTQLVSFNGTLDLFRLTTGSTTIIELANPGEPNILSLGSATGGGLMLAAGSALKISNNTLKIIGAGTINAGGQTGKIHVSEGVIDITSSSAQNSNLYVDENDNNIYLLASGLTGAGTLVVQTPVNITDGLKVRNGTLNANGNVTLISTSQKTANLQEIENNGRVIGNIIAQRHVSQKPRVYRYMTSPVEGTTVADWQQFFAITGPFAGASTGPGLGTAHSMYRHTFNGWVGYPANSYPAPENTNQAPIGKGKGYAVFIRNETEFLINHVGVPNQGPVTYDLYPENPAVEDTDWNLLGNPYASTIAWSNNTQAWIKSQIGTVVAVRNNINATTNQFQYYDAATGLGTGEGGTLDGGRIAPGQAFWVQTTGQNPTLTITESAKSTGQQQFYREGASDLSYVKINVRQNSRYDQALLVLTDFGTDDFDNGVDGPKMKNAGLFNLGTITADGLTLAINNLADEFCTKSVFLSLQDIQSGTYTLEFESPETLIGVGSFTLIDHFNKSTTDIFSKNSYSFSVTSDVASYGNSRFELIMERPALDLSIRNDAAIACEEPAKITLLNTQAGANYMILSSDLSQITDTQVSIGGNIAFEIPVEHLTEGKNEFLVRSFFKGCNSGIVVERIRFDYYSPPSVIGNDVSVCAGSTAELFVEASGSVDHFEWHNEQGKIKGATSTTFTTLPVTEEQFYVVNAVTPSGCPGPKHLITVTPELLETPLIRFSQDSIVTSTHGQEYIWSLNGEMLLSSTNAYYLIPGASGNYTLTVKQGGCTKSSESLLVNLEAKNLADFRYELYPNPTSSENINLRVYSAGKEDIRISVVDVLGRESFLGVYSSQQLREGVRINAGNALSPGVYFLSIEQRSTKGKVKFIIKE